MGHRVTTPGMKYGKWTVLSQAKYAGSSPQYKCRCECGTVRVIPQGNLANGKSTQCRECSDKQRATKWELNVCPRCSEHYGRMRRSSEPNTACSKCVPSQLSEAKMDVPTVYPVSIGTIARASNVTRQAVSFHINKRGWNGMVSHAVRNWKVNPYELVGGGK